MKIKEIREVIKAQRKRLKKDLESMKKELKEWGER